MKARGMQIEGGVATRMHVRFVLHGFTWYDAVWCGTLRWCDVVRRGRHRMSFHGTMAWRML